MSQYVCSDCCLIMVQYISNLSWYYICKRCKQTKAPQHAIVFSSDDHHNENSRVTDIEQIIDDPNVQLTDDKCPKCHLYYKVFYYFGNKDTRLVCECDRPEYDEIPDSFQTGLASKDARKEMYGNKTTHYYTNKLKK